MSSARSSSVWQNTQQQPQKPVPPGFFPSRLHTRPLDQMTERELLTLYQRNKDNLSQPTPSTSTYHGRILAEQSHIQTILGLATIEDALHRTHITSDDAMDISIAPPSRTVEAKRRAIGRYQANTPQRGSTAVLGLAEAIEIERKAHVAALERQKRKLEKRMQRGLPLPGEQLTREEREARIRAYMNAKPTESDEDEDSDDDDDDDPSTWFEDEEDDGRKGQPLVDPDEISGIIRVDESRWGDHD